MDAAEYDFVSAIESAMRPRSLGQAFGQRGAVGDLTAGQRISTRYPTAGKATEDPLQQDLRVDIQTAKKDADAFKHNIRLMGTYENFSGMRGKLEDRSEAMINHMQSNLMRLWDEMPGPVRQEAMQWYDGANRIANEAARKYNMPVEATSAVYAALSPKTDWYINVARGDRMMDIMRNQLDTPYSQEMEAMLGGMRSKIGNRVAKQAIMDIRGKRLGELDDPLERALWIRLYDEAHNDKAYNIINPDGSRGEFMKTAKGEQAGMSWASAGMMAKAVKVMMDPSMANISREMGTMHKVRNFYNNIADPLSAAGDVTIDTHAIAANLMSPMSLKDAPVLHNFGSGVTGYTGPSSSGITGMQGTYGIMAEPYRRAAAELGVQPRQVQSVTWEGIRGVFNNKSPQIKAAAANVWDNFRRGRITQAEAQDAILELAGGMRAPTWLTTQ